MRATDSAGQTAGGEAGVKIDTAKPTISVSGNDAKWRSRAVTLTFTPVAGPSGVDKVEYRLNRRAWRSLEKAAGAYKLRVSAEGETIVRFRSTDGAGGVSEVGSCTVKIDKTPPSLRLAAHNLKLSLRNGGSLRLRLRWRDVASRSAALRVRITQYGTQKRKLDQLTLAGNGRWQTVTLPWRLRAPGLYHLHLVLTDQGGHQCTASATVVARR